MSFVRLVRAELPFAATLLVVTIGMVSLLMFPAHWLRGVLVVAAGFGVGAVLRLVLPEDRAGLLKVRRRAFDVACFGIVCVLGVIFGVLVPRA